MTNPTPRPKFGGPPPPKKTNWVLPVALLLVVGGGVVWFLNRTSSQVLAAKLEPEQHMTQTGQQGNITLSNGVVVSLGPQADIRVRETHVDLSGQAIFTIDSAIPAPLIVNMEKASVTAENGRYNMRHYPGDTAVFVTVEEGEVQIRNVDTPEAEPLVVGAGAAAQIDEAGTAVLVPGTPIDPAFSWTRGTLKFEQRQLGDVVKDVSRWYRLNVTVHDSTLASQVVSLQLGRKAMPDEIAKALNDLPGASAKLSESAIQITPEQ